MYWHSKVVGPREADLWVSLLQTDCDTRIYFEKVSQVNVDRKGNNMG